MSQAWSEEAERIRALRPRHVLFLCVANSSRSQMAAGIARAMAPAVKVSSAGSRPTAVHPLAVEVLADVGVDIRRSPSLRVDQIPPDDVDVVITLSAEDVGAQFRGEALRIHWPLPGPASQDGAQPYRLEAFTLVRDELLRRLAVVFGNHRVLPPRA